MAAIDAERWLAHYATTIRKQAIDQHHIITSAGTIAASPNPEVGLLDMVVLTTPGRMIYEEHYHKQYGDLVQPTIKALRELEADIWRVAAKVLKPPSNSVSPFHLLFSTRQRRWSGRVFPCHHIKFL